jgi:hypothetical protein
LLFVWWCIVTKRNVGEYRCSRITMATTTVVLESFTSVWRSRSHLEHSPSVFRTFDWGSLVLLAHVEPRAQELVQETTMTPKAPSNPRLLKKKRPLLQLATPTSVFRTFDWGSLVLLAHVEPRAQELVQETTITPKAPSNPRLLKKKRPPLQLATPTSTRVRSVPGFHLTWKRRPRLQLDSEPRLQLDSDDEDDVFADQGYNSWSSNATHRLALVGESQPCGRCWRGRTGRYSHA